MLILNCDIYLLHNFRNHIYVKQNHVYLEPFEFWSYAAFMFSNNFDMFKGFHN